ncbi:hypothetical protein MHYP_G00208330 [Metynnis hypsauchen]
MKDGAQACAPGTFDSSVGSPLTLLLDLANVYGSIPHKLVEVALLQHHVPTKVIDLILDYYSNFRLRVTAVSGTSDWHRLEKGIITGCTISVILFALAMNMIVKSAEVECRGPLTKSGVRQPPIRAFMDDLTVTTTSVPGSRWILQGLEKLITWARMSFKPAKSRSLVLKKGKVTDRYRFSLAGATIPSITEQPVKSLGKLFHCSLKDSSSIQRTSKELEGWLRCVDRSGLPGRFKAWIYQHSILPRILWPLLVYAVPITTVEAMERKISSYLRRWLGLPRSLSSAALYGSSNILQLPFSGLTEEFMVTRTREALQYRESRDEKVASAGVQPQGVQVLAISHQPGWIRPRENSGNSSSRRKCGQAWRKNEPAGWWEWDNKEPGLDGRMFCNGRSPGPTFGEQTPLTSGS